MKITKTYLRQVIKEELEAALNKNKKIFVLVGPPSVGKSTWIKNTFKEAPFIISRDDIVEKVAGTYGWTYDDMFATPPEDAKIGDSDEKYGNVVEPPSWMTWAKSAFDKVLEANAKVQELFNQRNAGAKTTKENIVIDMTNMNAGARKRALDAVSSDDAAEKIAVVFKFEGSEDIIKKVAAKRAEAAKRMGKSKTIPAAAFDRMFSSFEKPTTAEGFDKIVDVDNREMLASLANED
jgi:hypothetical protein